MLAEYADTSTDCGNRMLERLVLTLVLCGLCGVAHAGDAGASLPGSALDSPPPPSTSPDAGSRNADSGAQHTGAPSADVDSNGVHMSLHMMGGAGGGGAIRP
jgi:hypothetical protein